MPSTSPVGATARAQDTFIAASNDCKSKSRTSMSPISPPAVRDGLPQPRRLKEGSTNAKVCLPFDAPAFVLRDTIYVTSPEDISIQARKLQIKKLGDIFNRYMTQIQYGCKNPSCTAPTCLSCRRRQSKAPLRKYTVLSARALAYAQISERDPEAGLCHNEPKMPESVLEYRESIQKRKRRSDLLRSNEDSLHGQLDGDLKIRKTRSQHKTIRPDPATGRVQSRSASQLLDISKHTHDHGISTSPRTLSNLPENEAATKKDPKSFAQSLFGTLSLSLMHWMAFARGNHQTASSGEESAQERCFEVQTPCRCGSCPETSGEPTGSNGDRDPKKENCAIKDTAKDDVGKADDDGHRSPPAQEPCQRVLAKPRRSRSPATLHKGNESNTTGLSLDRFSESIHSLEVERLGISSSMGLQQSNQVSVPDEEGFSQIPTLNVLSKQSMQWMSQKLAKEPSMTTLSCKAPNKGENEKYEDIRAFCDQSLYFCLKSPKSLIDSVLNWHDMEPVDATLLQKFKLKHTNTFQFFLACFQAHKPVRVFQTFLRNVQEAYGPPPWLRSLQQRRQPCQKGSMESLRKGALQQQTPLHVPTYLDDYIAALICAIGLFLLAYPCTIDHMRNDRTARNTTFESAQEVKPECRESKTKSASVNDGRIIVYRRLMAGPPGIEDYSDEPNAFRLFETVMDLINTRLAFQEMTRSRKADTCILNSKGKDQDFAGLILRHLEDLPLFVTRPILQRCRLLISSSWNGNPVLRRASPVGGCLSFLAALYKNRQSLRLESAQFHMDFLASKLDPMEMPVEWLAFRPNNKEIHLLSYSFLFEPAILVTYFRAVNFSIMSKSFEAAAATTKCVREWATGGPTFPHSIRLYGSDAVLLAVRPLMAQYLVLTIRRDNVLMNAINQIWRRQRRELMRPLKVLLGNNEGEEGIDVGGVQQEFFVVLMAEALNPDYGMFVLNEKNRMSWFQPKSMEPLYKFEVLGILFSIAVYNSITLPITFPLAFYRKLLGLKVKTLHHISDGWPELAKGLQEMLDWHDGDVADVFMRTYEFAAEAFGSHINIDMKKYGRDDPWPPLDRKKGKEKAKTATFDFPPSPQFTPDDLSPPLSPAKPMALDTGSLTDVKGTSTPVSLTSDILDSEAPLVSDANREQFVKDYIFWLTDKSIRPQFDAFAKGFYTCLDRTALSMFTAEALKAVVEGHQHIDIDGLEKVTTYEDFTSDSPTVRAFWEVVRTFTPTQHAQLLEFVTATDRVPVNGIGSVTFRIQKNGYDDVRLPTSSTCFGTLLLPEYSNKEVLEEKLVKAIVNTKGFGVG